jgi:hypothetical protein
MFYDGIGNRMIRLFQHELLKAGTMCMYSGVGTVKIDKCMFPCYDLLIYILARLVVQMPYIIFF